MKINRTKKFNPKTFIGSNWSIESENKDSLKIKDLDISKLELYTGLKDGESYIKGEEKLKRLEGTIQFDAKIAQTLYEEKDQKTLKEIYAKFGCTWIEFLGTVLRLSDGFRYALCLYRGGDGSWSWHCVWLDGDRGAGSPALGFASTLSSVTKSSSDTLNLDLESAIKTVKKAGYLVFNPL